MLEAYVGNVNITETNQVKTELNARTASLYCGFATDNIMRRRSL